MSKADEMFKELGYEKEELNDDECIRYFSVVDYCIMFDLYSKCIKTVIDIDTELALELTIQELQAINEKVKELGWLDV